MINRIVPRDIPAFFITRRHGYELFDIDYDSRGLQRWRRHLHRAYFSYYAGGFRVAKIENDKLVEVGHFIDEGGNNFWGVQVWQKDGKEYVLASDRDYGLYIFEYTGP